MSAPDNPLLAYFLDNPGRLINKWMHYFDIYHRHLARHRGKPCTLVEFGVFHGGSLQASTATRACPAWRIRTWRSSSATRATGVS
jgi:hypothetical protein